MSTSDIIRAWKDPGFRAGLIVARGFAALAASAVLIAASASPAAAMPPTYPDCWPPGPTDCPGPDPFE